MSGHRPSWYPDPTQRHELRYWDGSEWTSHVSDDGVPGTDVLTEPRSTRPLAVSAWILGWFVGGPIPAIVILFVGGNDMGPWFRRHVRRAALFWSVILAGYLTILVSGVTAGDDATGRDVLPWLVGALAFAGTGWGVVAALVHDRDRSA